MKSTGLLFVLSSWVVFCNPSFAQEINSTHEGLVFQSGEDGYHTYRIPGLLLTKQGTLLAFCEGRKTSMSDAGDIDLVLKRSSDGGVTWSDLQLVYEQGGDAKITIGNPCPVVDQSTGTIWLPLCQDNDRVLMLSSTDDGITWTEPKDITATVKKEKEWGWYATGPGHGIQLEYGIHKGRLVIPCDFQKINTPGIGEHRHSHIIFSDDHGATWQLGGETTNYMNECEVVERVDGSLLLCMRNYLGKDQRAFCVSTDGGETWSAPELHEDIYCPVCQASIQRYSTAPENIMLYSGPSGKGRNNLTLRVSKDEGKTWPVSQVVHSGPSAYSDLAVLSDGTIVCLYEGAEKNAYAQIRCIRLELK